MRNFVRFGRGVFLAIALLQAGALSAAHADPLESTAAEPVLPDPTPQASHNFPATTATAGSADPGRELGAIAAPRGNEGCSAASPCAIPPPPLQHVETSSPHQG